MNSGPDPSSDDPLLPPALLDDLQAMYRTPAVPPAVDAAVRNRARAYFAGQRRIRLWVRWSGAAAAVLVLGVGMWMTFFQNNSRRMAEISPAAQAPPSQSGARPAFEKSLPEDIDQNGRVDVLDAFTVARGIKARQTQPAWDINHDGVVDQQDVDQIANRAVRVKGGQP